MRYFVIMKRRILWTLVLVLSVSAGYLAWGCGWFLVNTHTWGAPGWPHPARLIWWSHFKFHDFFLNRSPTPGTYRFWMQIWSATLSAVLLLAVFGVVYFGQLLKRCRKPGTCVRCGYDLRATSAGTCPECGEAIQFEND